MHARSCLSLGLAASFLCCPGVLIAKSPKPEKATVHFLATSTSYRANWGHDQDVYLVELTPQKAPLPILAKLVDDYSSTQPELSLEILTSSSATRLKVVRDFGCDVAFGDLQLRTAPGDPKSILPEVMHFQPSLAVPPQASASLPCYVLVHRSPV